MRVAGDATGLAGHRNAAIRVAIPGKRFAADRHDLAVQEVARRQGTVEAAGGEFVHLAPRDLIAPGQLLRRPAHGAAGRRVEQRLPQKILELHLAEAEPAAMRVRRHRVAAHAFGADT